MHLYEFVDDEANPAKEMSRECDPQSSKTRRIPHGSFPNALAPWWASTIVVLSKSMR
jgi:hypothetical protein